MAEEQQTNTQQTEQTTDYESRIAELENLVAKQKSALSKANSEAAENKRKYEATLTEQQKEEAKREQHEAEREALLQQLLAEKVVSNNAQGFADSLDCNNEVAKAFASCFEKEVNPEFFVALKKYKGELDKHNTINRLQNTPKPLFSGNNTLTKEDIMNIKNSEERQRKIAENIELFQ